MAILKGRFIHRIYSCWPNSYHVYEFETDSEKSVSVIYRGVDTPKLKGPDYMLQGSWGHSNQYGWQFYIRTLEPEEVYTERHAARMSELKQMVAL